MLTLVIVNTVLCLLGIVPCVGLQTAAVMGGASEGGNLGSLIAIMGAAVPLVPVVSIIGSWVAYAFKVRWLTIGMVALPWVYLLVLLAAIGLLFALA